ncbi:hypothetical protein CDAR_592851 [Caerostris darwini]|uniref:Uncharacterized protein n=1 Tax=Caerostris darwini TaxID=1538125 RepID=A0AAV4QJE3_9ARAC|nr:hypothetical protein CDAR_592851 [Caerostris darwini]
MPMSEMQCLFSLFEICRGTDVIVEFFQDSNVCYGLLEEISPWITAGGETRTISQVPGPEKQFGNMRLRGTTEKEVLLLHGLIHSDFFPILLIFWLSGGNGFRILVIKQKKDVFPTALPQRFG